MVSLIAVSSANFIFCNQPISYLSSNSCLNFVSAIIPQKRDTPLNFERKESKQNKKNQFFIEFSRFCGVVRMCKNYWGGECDPSLELEVLEFMKNSKNPQKFPTKIELIDAGRSDLVDAIMNNGGWMTVGWDDDEVSVDDGLKNDMEYFLEKYGQNGCESKVKSRSNQIQERFFEGDSFLGYNSSATASSSGRSLEVATEDESGIEGILNRLERQRNMNFGFKLGKNGTSRTTMDYAEDECGDNNQNNAIRKVVDSCHPQRNEPASTNHDRPMISGNGLSKSSSNGYSSSSKLDAWRTWSVQRAGSSDLTKFEAGEIDFGKNNNRGTVEKSMDDIVAITTRIRGAQDNGRDSDTDYREITRGELKTRLQRLEVELSSALHSLRSNSSDLSEKAKEQLSEDLRELSDVSEFQENEMMNAQDKLRTLRAKLAVLEGKMSLAILDAQHILDEKQKRINDARTALQLLRTTSIIWPNSGSEVLLAGSFDGWATQRKMKRSSSGIFSLCLKLYPGRYEIKFIVDGVWRVDPLRPIVNNGFENNLLTIT